MLLHHAMLLTDPPVNKTELLFSTHPCITPRDCFVDGDDPESVRLLTENLTELQERSESICTFFQDVLVDIRDDGRSLMLQESRNFLSR